MKKGLMQPTHTHDCERCEYVGATHSDMGVLTDWYVHEQYVIGRNSSEGSDYSCMDMTTLHERVAHPSRLTHECKYVFSERALVAFAMLNLWREQQ